MILCRFHQTNGSIHTATTLFYVANVSCMTVLSTTRLRNDIMRSVLCLLRDSASGNMSCHKQGSLVAKLVPNLFHRTVLIPSQDQGAHRLDFLQHFGWKLYRSSTLDKSMRASLSPWTSKSGDSLESEVDLPLNMMCHE